MLWQFKRIKVVKLNELLAKGSWRKVKLVVRTVNHTSQKR